jgi:hypothetical protein
MVIILYTGIFFILVSVVVNLIEIKKFLRALNILNMCTRTGGDRVKYLPRLIGLLPMLSPIIPDVIAFIIGGSVGLNAGFYGFILGTAASSILTLGIKFMLWLNRSKDDSFDYKTQIANLRRTR